MSIEAMKQALEALEEWCPMTATYLDYRDNAITALRQAIEQAEKQEPVAWKNAAIRIGEELSSVGPDGYYNMTAEQWLDWAMDQRPRGKNSLPAAQRQWVGLTDEEIEIVSGHYTESEGFKHGARWALDQLKEKNT